MTVALLLEGSNSLSERFENSVNRVVRHDEIVSCQVDGLTSL